MTQRLKALMIRSENKTSFEKGVGRQPSGIVTSQQTSNQTSDGVGDA